MFKTAISTRTTGMAKAILLVAAITLLLLIADACADSLRRTCFITGWMLFIVLSAAFIRRYLKLRSGAPAEQWVGPQTALASLTLVLFLTHIGFTFPNGWFDTTLTLLFLVISITTIIGTMLWTKVRTGAITTEDARAIRRWQCVHTPCIACLLALGSMHGVIAHAHGLLAHVMLGK